VNPARSIDTERQPRRSARGKDLPSQAIAPLRVPGAQRSSCACGGGCPRCREQYPLQAKLQVSQPGDALEQEADRIAEQVLRGPQAEARDAPESREGSQELAPLVNEVLSTPGEPLDPATRDFMEPRFGRDLGQVRIHRDEHAAESTRSVNARAYTVGTHVVFGEGEYAPSGDAGKRLLAHEVAHVLQQDRSGSLAVQRREGKYPDPPEKFESSGTTFEWPYTILKPKKLNAKGPFSAAILDLISRWYTDVPETCVPIGAGQKGNICIPARFNAQQAVLILKLLESSSEFLAIAAKLDAFYAEEKNPGFRIFGGAAGMKFVPAGVPYRGSRDGKATAEELDVIMLDTSVNPRMRERDPLQPASEDEQVAVAFVDALVHEAVHAFRRVSKLSKGGLKGSIEEERATRKKSSAILKQISAGSAQKGIKEQAEGYIQDIAADTLTLKQVALSMVSGDEITYLESYYVDSAFGQFFEKYSNSKRDSIPELADLDDPSQVTSGGADEHASKLLSLIERHSEPREILVDRDASMTGVEPPLRVKKLPPLSPRFNAHDVFRLTVLLAQTENLKDLASEATKVKKFSPAGLAVFYHVLLVKTSLIRERLKQEHKDSGLDPTSKDHEKLCNELARKFLGETKPYDKLK
jgi:uncharacterized protein DUF4157